MLLGCIALLPLICEHRRHANRNKGIVSFGLALPVVVYLLAIDGDTNGESSRQLLHELFEYASFIIMLTVPYTGRHPDHRRYPRHAADKRGFLAIGALLANIIGTTGASTSSFAPALTNGAPAQDSFADLLYLHRQQHWRSAHAAW